MRYLVGTGNFNTAAMENIDKPKTTDPDGPAGFTNFMTVIGGTATVYDTCFYASECVIAVTMYNYQPLRLAGSNRGKQYLSHCVNDISDDAPQIIYLADNACSFRILSSDPLTASNLLVKKHGRKVL